MHHKVQSEKRRAGSKMTNIMYYVYAQGERKKSIENVDNNGEKFRTKKIKTSSQTWERGTISTKTYSLCGVIAYNYKWV